MDEELMGLEEGIPEQMPMEEPQMPMQEPEQMLQQMPNLGGNLIQGEDIDETSDVLFASPQLNEKDKKLATNILDINLKDFKKKKKDIFFRHNEEQDFVKNIDYAVKAILGHELKKREGK